MTFTIKQKRAVEIAMELTATGNTEGIWNALRVATGYGETGIFFWEPNGLPMLFNDFYDGRYDGGSTDERLTALALFYVAEGDVG